MNLVLQAINFVNEKHEGQTRKVTGHPYASHPLAVSYLLARYKKSKNIELLIVSALLHDSLEDTDATFAEIADKFGPMVASIVFELTNDENAIKAVGKTEYMKKKMIGLSSYALVIKLVDRLHNMSDHPTDKMKTDTIDIIEHLMENRKLSKTQSAICADILEICKDGTTKSNQ